MEWVALALLTIFSLLGFFAIFFTTFGTFILLIGIVAFAFLTDFIVVSIQTLTIIVGLYLFGELMEWVLTVVGAKKMGASNAAVVGALVGGVLGAILGAPLLGVGLFSGTFVGLFLGAFLVEWLFKKKDMRESIKAGIGGLLGRLGAIGVKLIVALFMLGIVIQQIVLAGGMAL